MLTNLSIANYALIEKLDMEPCSGLNMITGETGAGKSIMLGAVGLLLGNRADTKTLFNEENKCIIEGVFHIAHYGLKGFFEKYDLDFDEVCIIRREIAPSGKSRAFINDTPVNLEVLKQLGKILVDVHSQHENLLLSASSYQLSLIDAYGQTQKEMTEYQKLYREYTSLQQSVKKLESEVFSLNQEADYNQFQLEELSSLALEPGEQEGLESQQELLQHAEEIKSKANEILSFLEDDQIGALQTMGNIKQQFQFLAKFGKSFEDLNNRFESVWIELQDISQSLASEEHTIEVDFEKLEWTSERLSKIYQLQKKHGVHTDRELIELTGSLSEKVIRMDHIEEQLAQDKISLEKVQNTMKDLSSQLSKRRMSVFSHFSNEIQELLGYLGMENAKVEVRRREIAPNHTGTDEIDILFSANKGIAPQPIGQVASGGEFSRLMFAVKYIMADKMALPTLIFDEIDTGISGEVALQMVRMMQKISINHQVICITHLPQVAAKGEKHYFVYKDNSQHKTISKIKLLSESERMSEIAQMISGSNPSASAFESAKELLGS
ncbi:MAG: DNA repair protein RecN [Cyclobacteriaceae bacterium]